MDNAANKKSDEIVAQTKSQALDGEPNETKTIVSDSTILDLLDISTNEPNETDCLLDIFSNAANGCRPNNAPAQSPSSSSSSNLLTFDFLKKIHGSSTAATSSCVPSSSTTSLLSSLSSSEANKGKSSINKSKMSDKKASAWMNLFADLDPLSNPTAMEKKIAGSNQNCLDA